MKTRGFPPLPDTAKAVSGWGNNERRPMNKLCDARQKWKNKNAKPARVGSTPGSLARHAIQFSIVIIPYNL